MCTHNIYKCYRKTILKVRALENQQNYMHQTKAQIIVLFDLTIYVPSTIFQLNRDGSSCVEPVLS